MKYLTTSIINSALIIIAAMAALTLNGCRQQAGNGKSSSSITGSAENMTFEDWDKNDDHGIDRSEFISTFVAKYSPDWDNTNNSGLDDEDFYHTTYAIIDANHNDLLDADEWRWGYDHYFKGHADSVATKYDLDGDGMISYAEYDAVLKDNDYFLVWDADHNNFLSEFELADGVFSHWDLNNNGMLSKEEYNALDDYYLFAGI